MFEQCEEALVKTIHITSCAKLHISATKVGAKKILKHCKQLMSFYWNDVQSQELFEMDVDSMTEMTVSFVTYICNDKERSEVWINFLCPCPITH